MVWDYFKTYCVRLWSQYVNGLMLGHPSGGLTTYFSLSGRAVLKNS